jgi:hypothetical protein
MRKITFYSIIAIALLSFPSKSLGQVLNLGSLSNFAAYSGTGAISNTGTSSITGDLGTNVGAISGFGLPSTAGTLYNANAVTTQAKIDLLRIYIHLSDLKVTNTTHAAAFGSGESITAGVYSIAGAGSVAGTLILNGQGNPNAAFVIKFEGGLSVAAGSSIVLSNGTRACNVFWIAEGAISIGASTITKGTLIAHPGAITIGAGGTLEGRMFSTEGAVSFGPGIASLPVGPITIPISCVNTCDNNILGTAANFALFTSVGAVANAATSGIIGDIGANVGDISGFASSTVAGSFYNVNAVTAQAKIDLDAAYVQLNNTPATNTTHTPAFGSGETLTAGVYSIAAAGSLAGTLTLDGQGNSNALFIFKFGGAFTTAAQSKVILTNGVRRCNVFWVAEGAVSMGTFTFMKGTLIAHNGANTMGANGNLEGRMLSTAGAIGFSTGVIYNNTLCFQDPIDVITAVNDAATINGFTGGTYTNVLSNDTLNGSVALATQVATTFVSSTNTGITLSGNNVNVAAGTPAGNYALVYKICQISNPSNCSQATVVITVTAPVILAINDSVTITGSAGGLALNNVLINDKLNGIAVVAAQVNTSFVSASHVGVTLSGANVMLAPGIPAGTYTLVYRICQVTNPTNCSQATVTINILCATIANPTVAIVQPTCALSTGMITIIAPVGIGFSYSINGITFQTSTVFSGLAANTYNVTAKSGTCVSAIKSAVINSLPLTPIAPIIVLTQPTCSLTTGTITISSPIGTGLTYSVNGSVYQSSPIFSGLAANGYSVTVKNGTCTSTATAAILSVAVLPAKPTVALVQPSCSVSTGKITVTAPIATGLLYSINGVTFQSSRIFSLLNAGSYNVTVKNGTCLSAIRIAVINSQPATPATPTVVITQMSVTLASATITVTSPLGIGLTYSINGTTYQSSPVFSGITIAKRYYITAKLGACISSSRVAIVKVRPPLSDSIFNTIPIVTNGKGIDVEETFVSKIEGTMEFKVVLYPNPSLANFELNIQSSSTEMLEVKITDSNGRLIKTLQSNVQEKIQFGKEWSSGLYFIEVSQGSQRKLIKGQKL